MFTVIGAKVSAEQSFSNVHLLVDSAGLPVKMQPLIKWSGMETEITHF